MCAWYEQGSQKLRPSSKVLEVPDAGKPHCVRVQVSATKVVFLAAPTRADANRWLEALHAHVKLVRGG